VTLFAQAEGNISAVVSDRSDSAIPGAVVILKRNATQGVRVAKANSEGFCTAVILHYSKPDAPVRTVRQSAAQPVTAPRHPEPGLQ